MPQLQPAGFFSGLGSYFSPKKVMAQVRSETLPNGKVQLTPYFTIDGQEVPSDLVKVDEHQTILGYTVVLTSYAEIVHKKLQGKPQAWAKGKAATVLKELQAKGVDARSKNGRVQPRIEKVKPEVSLELHEGDTLKVDSELQTAEGAILDKPTSLDQLIEDGGWYAVGDDLVEVELTKTPLDQKLVIEGGNGWFTGDDVPRLIDSITDHHPKLGEVVKNDTLKDLEVFSGKPENRGNIDGNEESISISPTLTYPGTKGREYGQSPSELQDFENQGKEYKRISDGWVKITPDQIQRFRRAYDELKDKIGSLDDIRGTKIPEILSGMEKTKWRDHSVLKSPWTVYFSEAVKNAHRLVDTAANVKFKINVIENGGRSLLELDPIYNHDRFTVNHSEVQQADQKGEKWIRRKGAWVKLDRDKFGNIEKGANRLNLQRGPNGFTFSATQRDKVIEVFSRLGSIEHSSAYLDFVKKLEGFQKIDHTPLPDALKRGIDFRLYQQHGFNWLAFLHKFGLNGILADDMGLGKTLQTLAVIHHSIELSSSNYPSLIICPTSVINNWGAEVKKFFQNPFSILYTGSNRQGKLDDLERRLAFAKVSLRNSPIVITSYNIARLDQEQLSKFPWLYVVVDEGHNIRNPSALQTKAIKTLNGQHKLVLTGTPIQNTKDDLWSLFDFAMPGFLGTLTEFRTLYVTAKNVNVFPVNDTENPLKKRINPFLLRRLKKDVASDLPDKIIIDQVVELTPRQVRLYKAAIESPQYKKMVDKVAKDGIGRSQLMILATIAKLRNICNHPICDEEANENEPVDYDNVKSSESGKLEALEELIEEIVDGNKAAKAGGNNAEVHRALLFSQSTKALDMIEHFFKKWKVTALRLDGNTPQNKRQQLCDDFNNEKKAITCFLISTRAGGTGLNLTGADTVIFYDHDWNPANDLQAQDRAHRIGQTKNVTVYRLVSKGTIEEKILERQAIKQTLADEVIGSDENGFKNLTKEELLSLFTFDESEE